MLNNQLNQNGLIWTLSHRNCHQSRTEYLIIAHTLTTTQLMSTILTLPTRRPRTNRWITNGLPWSSMHRTWLMSYKLRLLWAPSNLKKLKENTSGSIPDWLNRDRTPTLDQEVIRTRTNNGKQAWVIKVLSALRDEKATRVIFPMVCQSRLLPAWAAASARTSSTSTHKVTSARAA